MRSASCLLLLALASSSHQATCSPSFSGSYNPVHGINIATAVSTSDSQDQHNSTSSAGFEDPIDLVLVANTSNSSSWLDGVAGYTTAAESRVLYQAASWSLLEEGTQSGKFSSYWARFQSVNPTKKSSVYLSVCTMVAEWNSSWSDSKSALSAVEVENRLTAKCGENDTIAVAFTSTVSKTAASYLEGEVAVNDVVASLKMDDVDSSLVLEASDRMFVRPANGLCPRDGSNNELNSLVEAGVPVISLFRGLVCKPSGGFGPSQITSEDSGSSNDSEWNDDLKFIIPIGIFVFLLGCAGLIYLYRQQKKASAEEPPKEVEKDEASSLPYVLTMQSVV
ncbi:hypothetical protein PR003_g28684 [Phytophthora rubi]|uniref:Uncharacterized protein n=1 Tax=Phytophthora rubi TaxID=129364 RepID=A0A6A3HGL4_9STRA|nr:hypothetical protein PR002_g27731 [Phytophthora rubi]KAE8969199.1 hypothetical protein PR001_g27572 [Phytophthora rubi]KAE9277823.1 hypothetical protein PR003_g28684 [Phytophthora rubi]